MTLLGNRYGKDRVRILRLHREGEHHEVRELTLKAMLTGDFADAYTAADNSRCLCTDTVKNVINIVGREQPALDTEAFCQAVARRFLDHYPQVTLAEVTAHETKWTRLTVDGEPHPHGFTLDSNGKPFASVTATRDGVRSASGVAGFTFMKSTQSGWEGFHKDAYTTLRETRDRICATSMDASWRWTGTPADYRAANAAVLRTMLRVFMTTYSASVQDSLYRMGRAALDAVPEIGEIGLACPNKHYIPIDLSAFAMSNENVVFLPTDEPQGLIECTVGRD